MTFNQLRIGYVPYDNNLKVPGDRRRFIFFAKTNSIPFELADRNKYYDIILLTAHTNLTLWLDYKKKNPKTKFIFEMIDSMIFSYDIFRNIFKGSGRYILGKESHLNFNYKDPIIKWLKAADAVICSSTELKTVIKEW